MMNFAFKTMNFAFKTMDFALTFDEFRKGALSTFFLALGWIINPFWAMNKQTWSPSYLFFMAGSCGYLLIALYVVYDLPANPLDPSYTPFWRRFLRRFFEPARWVGMNTVRVSTGFRLVFD